MTKSPSTKYPAKLNLPLKIIIENFQQCKKHLFGNFSRTADTESRVMKYQPSLKNFQISAADTESRVMKFKNKSKEYFVSFPNQGSVPGQRRFELFRPFF